jgi:hypothetical protein
VSRRLSFFERISVPPGGVHLIWVERTTSISNGSYRF